MDDRTLRDMIERLRQELQEVRYAIWALERLALGKPRRGRPPKVQPRSEGRAKPRTKRT